MTAGLFAETFPRGKGRRRTPASAYEDILARLSQLAVTMRGNANDFAVLW
jgi:hypothetical protein